MAHAIDRDALHARLVKAVDAWAKGCEATVRPLTARLIERLKNSKVTTPISKIVDDEMRKLGIDASLRKSMRELVIDAVAHGYGILPTMMADRDKVGDKLMTTPWSGDSMTLSERLYQNAKHMRAVVADSIQTARRQGQTFTQAARVLYDGYNSGQRVIDAARLPQYMANVEQAARHVLSGGDLRDFQREMRRAQRAVDRLAKGGAPNKALKSAYRQMLNAAATGSERHLERAIRTAVEERSRYHAERIARTEAARAYFDGFIARNANDDDVVGYKWTIGGRHPKTDICDDYAAQDAHGLGAGIFPKDKLPAYPAHPHCLCHLSEVYADEVPGYKRAEGAAEAQVIEGRVEANDIMSPDAKIQLLEVDIADKQKQMQDLLDSDGNLSYAIRVDDAGKTRKRYLAYLNDQLKTAKRYGWEDVIQKNTDLRDKANKYFDARDALWKAQRELVELAPLGQPPAKNLDGLIRMEKPHTLETGLSGANPLYSTRLREWTLNCQRCVPTYEMRRRGFDVVAKPRILDGSDTMPRDGVIQHDIFKGAEVITGGKALIKDMLKEWGPGARCEIGVDWKGGGGHVFVAENVDGKIVFIDPQTNNTDCEQYFQRAKTKQTYFFRTDTLMPNDRMWECIKEASK